MTEHKKYVFTVKEGDGAKWIAFEPSGGDLTILQHGVLCFDLPDDTSYECASEIARFLNDNIECVGYMPIDECPMSQYRLYRLRERLTEQMFIPDHQWVAMMKLAKSRGWNPDPSSDYLLEEHEYENMDDENAKSLANILEGNLADIPDKDVIVDPGYEFSPDANPLAALSGMSRKQEVKRFIDFSKAGRFSISPA